MKQPKTVSQDLQAHLTISASKAAIFAIISDHVGTPNWVAEVGEVKLLKAGNPKNGEGAIREVHFRPKFWTTVQERIVAYTENEGFQYKIISKMPGVADHLGEWKLEDAGAGKTKVTWAVHFDFKRYHWFRLLGKKFAADFGSVQNNALQQLKKTVER